MGQSRQMQRGTGTSKTRPTWTKAERGTARGQVYYPVSGFASTPYKTGSKGRKGATHPDPITCMYSHSHSHPPLPPSHCRLAARSMSCFLTFCLLSHNCERICCLFNPVYIISSASLLPAETCSYILQELFNVYTDGALMYDG